MNPASISDPNFRKAVKAIEEGDFAALHQLLVQHPALITSRADVPTEGYFKHPYLMWFVAGNPVRQPRLPDNIIEITRLLIGHARQLAPDSLQAQLDYTLVLVSSGLVPRESGTQLDLIDLLIDEGAVIRDVHAALAHHNLDAAKRLLDRGGRLSLAATVALDLETEFALLSTKATNDELQTALMVAAFFGKHLSIEKLLNLGADPNGSIGADSGFHHHASPLHQAVYAQSLESIRLLTGAGADKSAKDHIHQATPVDWARHGQLDSSNPATKEKFLAIEKFLLHE